MFEALMFVNTQCEKYSFFCYKTLFSVYFLS